MKDANIFHLLSPENVGRFGKSFSGDHILIPFGV
jgi:hypothetical protein